MLEKITHNWWMFAVRGLVAVIFGVAALIWHQQVLQAMVLVFGAFALVDGILNVSAGLSSAPFFNRWWALVLEGVVGILFGLMAIFLPAITVLALLYFVAAWAIITGILEIVAAIEFRRVLPNEWMLILAGVLSMVFGVLLFVFPGAGMVSMVWLIGIFAIVYGISEMVFAFRLQGLRREFEKASESYS
jgi:uncharacterized membrane protein HdeD (DUF308 family)